MQMEVAPLMRRHALAVAAVQGGPEHDALAGDVQLADGAARVADLAGEGIADPARRGAAMIRQQVVVLTPGRKPLVAAVDALGEAGPRQPLPGERAVLLGLHRRPVMRARTPGTRRHLLAQRVAVHHAHAIVHLLETRIVEVGDDRLPGVDDVAPVMMIVAKAFLARAGLADAGAVAPAPGGE